MSMIETRNLTKRYGDVTAVEGVDITVEYESIHGFVGHNGAGKSTTMRILVGLATPTEGTVRIDGEPAGSQPATEKIGYSPQDPELYDEMTGRDYLVYVGKLAGMNSGIRDRADELLERFEIADAATQPIGSYSGGMERKLSLAQAMMDEPELLVLDEPTAELDPEARASVIDALEDLTEQGVTVFVSSHVLAELEQFVDTVTILQNGEVATAGPIEELRQAVDVETYVLESSDDARLQSLLEDHDSVEEVNLENARLQVIPTDAAEFRAALPTVMSDAGLEIRSLQPESGLEETFLKLLDEERED
jgi:ABC-2 type transport system ATP-binding protein